MMYAVFKLARTKGDLALEAHVENPHESDLFQAYPTFPRTITRSSSCATTCVC